MLWKKKLTNAIIEMCCYETIQFYEEENIINTLNCN